MLAALLLAAAAAWTPAEVCANPASPCPGFSPNDLSFPLPRDGIARPEVRSAPFYAVILASGARCGFGERERRAAQAVFPEVKVFSHRFGCEDPKEMGNVTYTNIDPKLGFLAVYAGADRKAGEAMLARVKATGKFPGANLRRMQGEYVFP